MTAAVALAPSPRLAELRARWDNPFDETPVFAQLMGATLAAPCGTRLDCGGWVPDVTVAARRGVRDTGMCEEAILTADGRPADPTVWCQDHPGAVGVYYERWTDQGRVTHGMVCERCRRLSQSG